MSPLEALSIMAQTAEAFVAGKRPNLNECVLVQQALSVLSETLSASKPLANLVPTLDKKMAEKKAK